MKKIIISAFALLGFTSPIFSQDNKDVSNASASSIDSFSYAIGVNIAENMKNQGINNVDVPSMSRAFNDVFNNYPTAMSSDQAMSIIQRNMQELQAKKQEEQSQKAAEEGMRSKKFLEENKKRKGVIVLPNGLQYQVLVSGKSGGRKPTPADTVVVHYVGTLIDGTEFDNSIKRGEPAEFPLGGVIKGWTEILQRMTPGDKWKVYIPSELGYGERGAGASIPGNATLIFEINFIKLKPAAKK